MVVRVTGIDSAVGCYLDREEEMGVARSRNIVRSISHRRQPGRGRNARGDTAVTTADIDSAVILIDRDSASLSNGSGGGCVSVGKSAIDRALDLGDGRLESSIEEIDRAWAEELQPLPVIPRGAAGSAPARIRSEERR